MLAHCWIKSMPLTADMSAAVNAVQGAYRESSKSMREDVESCVSLIRASEFGREA